MQYFKDSIFKKGFFYFLTFFLIVLFYLFLDLIISNTILKSVQCYDYTSYKKGHIYFLKKNCQTRQRFRSSFPSTNIFTDEFGLRVGKDTVKNPDNKNILIFGDSMTFGVGLEFENTYAGWIDKKMEDYNVYNFGVGSYAPSVHLYRLQNAIKDNITPNKILLFLDLSDVMDEARRWVDGEDGIPKRPEGSKPSWAKDANKKKKLVEKNFKLSKEIAALVNFNLRKLRSEAKHIVSKNVKVKTSIQGAYTYTKLENLDKRFWNKNDFSKGLIKVNEKISKISRIAEENNSEFYLIIYPWGETLLHGEKEFSWSNFGEQLCSKKKCILINAIPEFNKYKKTNKNWTNDLYFLNDEHLNKGGAKLLADIVLKKLNK